MCNDTIILHEFEYKKHRVKIEYEKSQEFFNPREWDNLGTMICRWNGYTLGDEQTRLSVEEYFMDKLHENHWKTLPNKILDDYQSYNEIVLTLEEILEKLESFGWVILPLYIYEHGGITMSTSSFSCPWDSGLGGFIFASRETTLKEYSRKNMSKKLRELVEKVLRSEVSTYDDYLRGDIYWYGIYDENDDLVESCGGFYDDYFKNFPYMSEETKSIIDHITEREMATS